MIYVTPDIAIKEIEVQEAFIRSSGPGGQNVNKVATAVQLRFHARRSPSLPDEVRERLIRMAGRKVTKEGVLIIVANRFRTQEQNRRDAMERLVELVRKAAERPRLRRPSRPTLASKKRRLETKIRRSNVKRSRHSAPRSED